MQQLFLSLNVLKTYLEEGSPARKVIQTNQLDTDLLDDTYMQIVRKSSLESENQLTEEDHVKSKLNRLCFI